MKPDFKAYSVGLVSASVCTNLPIEQATDQLNTEHPTGLESQWHLSEDKFFSDGEIANGSPCPDNPTTHKHYLFNC
jgi:hypothetical protein